MVRGSTVTDALKACVVSIARSKVPAVEWIFLDLTGRNDWSSALPAASNSYFYPSANLGLVLRVLAVALTSTAVLLVGRRLLLVGDLFPEVNRIPLVGRLLVPANRRPS